MTKPFYTTDDCDVWLSEPPSNYLVERRGLSLSHANALFEKRTRERGRVVYGHDDGHWSPSPGWISTSKGSPTHTALILNVEPLEQDSAEKLLREIKDYWCSDKQDGCYWQRLVGRIEALLEKGAGK